MKNNEFPSLLAPPLIGSDRVKGDEERLVKILLHGLTDPIDGTDYGIMMSVGNNSDEWVANVASYIRNLNDASPVEHHSVKEIRKRNKDRARYWTLKELEYK